MHPWKLHLLLLSSFIIISCVRWSFPWSNEAQQTSPISCRHNDGSTYITLHVIVIRRRSLPSSPPLDMVHHIFLVLGCSYLTLDEGNKSSAARWTRNIIMAGTWHSSEVDLLMLHKRRRMWMVENQPQRWYTRVSMLYRRCVDVVVIIVVIFIAIT